MPKAVTENLKKSSQNRPAPVKVQPLSIEVQGLVTQIMGVDLVGWKELPAKGTHQYLKWFQHCSRSLQPPFNMSSFNGNDKLPTPQVEYKSQGRREDMTLLLETDSIQ